MKLTRRDFTAGLAVGIAAPYVIGSARAQGATIKIGMCVPVTGPAAEQGLWAQNGAKLALAAVNKAGGVLGKQVELVIEDDQTTNPGIVLAFSKLAAQSDIVAFLGSIRSTQVHGDGARRAQARQAGDDRRHQSGPHPYGQSSGCSASVPTTAIPAASSPTTASTRSARKNGRSFIRPTRSAPRAARRCPTRLNKLGAPPVLDQGYANQSQDFTPVVLAVKQSGADVLGTYFTFENDLGIFARQLRQLGVNIPWVGSPSVVAVSSTKLAGPALFGTYGVADYAEDSSEASKAFGKAYRDAYKTAPDNQSAWPYDAITILSAAINKAGSTDPGKIREAILAVKKYAGAEGEYNFDQNGDGLHGYNVVKNEKGTIVYDKHIDFND